MSFLTFRRGPGSFPSVTRAPIWGAVSDVVILLLFIVCPLVGTCSILSYFLPCKPHPSSVRSEWQPALALGISLTLFSGARLHSGWPCWWPVLRVELSLVSCFHLSNFCIFTSVWWRFHVEDWGFDTSPIGLCWPEWVSVVGSVGLSEWVLSAQLAWVSECCRLCWPEWVFSALLPWVSECCRLCWPEWVSVVGSAGLSEWVLSALLAWVSECCRLCWPEWVSVVGSAGLSEWVLSALLAWVSECCRLCWPE